MRTSYLLVLVPAAVGTVFGAVAYFGQSTGVTGTPGAMIALIGAMATTIGAILALLLGSDLRVARTLNVLLVLGAVLTAVAAYFLMQTAFLVAMLVACLGIVVALVFPGWSLAR